MNLQVCLISDIFTSQQLPRSYFSKKHHILLIDIAFNFLEKGVRTESFPNWHVFIIELVKNI